jgi:hypothetical protein
LAKLLASENRYVLWVHKTKGTYNKNCETLEEAEKEITALDKSLSTVYIAVGKFADNIGIHKKTGSEYVQRKQDQATHFKSLCVDLDVDANNPTKYPSQREAAKTLFATCDKINLHRPMLINSGYGVHAYWPLTMSISKDMWVKMSTSLFHALTKNGCILDASKVHDPSMVLRPVGTHNKKDKSSWKEVTQITDVPEINPVELGKVLAQYYIPPAQKSVLSGKKKEQNQNAIVAAILNSEPVVEIKSLIGCGQMKPIIETNGALAYNDAKVSEPLWRASLGIAKFCIDKEQAAIYVSKGHPDYDEDDVLNKLDLYAGTGPTTCSTFDKLLPEGCINCPHKHTLTTPLQLGNGATEITEVNPETNKKEEIALPRGYEFKGNRIVYINSITNEELFVSSYLMWVVSRVTDVEESTNYANIAVKFPTEGVRLIKVESAVIAAGGNDLRKALAEKQVYIKENIEPIKGYFMNFLKKLQIETPADKSYAHLGWQDDGTFLAADNELIGSKDDTKVYLDKGVGQIAKGMKAYGSMDAYVNATKVYDLDEFSLHAYVYLVGLGAPLFAFSGLASAVVNMFSVSSGSGKTITGNMILAAWGNPYILSFTNDDTELSLYKKLGILRSAGGYADEITTKDDKTLRDFVMDVQRGKERNRLNRGADGFREGASWQMPFITSSNKDLYDVMAGKMTNEAEQLRVVQVTLERSGFLEGDKGTKRGKAWAEIPLNNYGHIGPMFVKAVFKEAKAEGLTIQQWASKMQSEMMDKGNTFLAKERFYLQIHALAYIAAYICNKYGLIKFNGMKAVNAGYKFISGTVRQRRENNRMSGLETVSQFLTECQDQIVNWIEKPTNKYVIQPAPRTASARKELIEDGNGAIATATLFISKQAFRYWCKQRGANYNYIVDDLIAAGISCDDNARSSLYRGVAGQSTGRVRCLEINLLSTDDTKQLAEKINI